MLLSPLHRLLHQGMDFIHPSLCAWCGIGLRTTGAMIRAALCQPCLERLGPPADRMCHRCAAPVGPYLDSTGGCYYCAKENLRFSEAVAWNVYEGSLREACLKAKQPGSRPMAAALAQQLEEYHRARLAALAVEAVVAVPHHWTQRATRHHNPAAVMAEVLARRLKVQFYRHILAKVRKTPAQTSLSPTQRRSNLRNAFRVRRAGHISGRSVLLVDDVLTTGSTASEVSRVLLKAGAQRVVVAVIARGLGRRR